MGRARTLSDWFLSSHSFAMDVLEINRALADFLLGIQSEPEHVHLATTEINFKWILLSEERVFGVSTRSLKAVEAHDSVG